MQPTRQVFISYKREDQAFAEKLRDKIRSWGYKTWIDIDNISNGDYWADAIFEGLQTSDVVIGVMTPEAIASRHIKDEWDWSIKYKKPFLLLIYREVKVPPPQHIDINVIDFSQDEEMGFQQLREAMLHMFPS